MSLYMVKQWQVQSVCKINLPTKVLKFLPILDRCTEAHAPSGLVPARVKQRKLARGGLLQQTKETCTQKHTQREIHLSPNTVYTPRKTCLNTSRQHLRIESGRWACLSQNPWLCCSCCCCGAKWSNGTQPIHSLAWVKAAGPLTQQEGGRLAGCKACNTLWLSPV